MFEEIQDFTAQNQAGAKCSLCNQHAREMPDGRRARTFRANLYIHMEGWVEVCELCITEGAVKIGMIPTAEAEELMALFTASQERGDALLHDLEDSRSTVRTLAQSLAVDAERHAAAVKQAYERGLDQGLADAALEAQEDEEVADHIASEREKVTDAG